MGIKRYTAIKDNTITNAFQSNLSTRGTGSNAGFSDSLQVFSIYAQASSASNEQSRILTQFPVLSSDSTSSVQIDRAAGTIPASGSVNFYLRLFNVAHDGTLPRNFTLVVSPISQSWQEGHGLDLDSYDDLTYDGTGSNWINAAAHTVWVNNSSETLTGGSYLSASWMGAPVTDYDEFNYKSTFGELGTSDIEVDITGLVEKWLASDYSNYGIGIQLTSSQASGNQSYYKKMFSARSSEYFFKRPIIEARWDSSRQDQRSNFYISSSALSSTDNKSTLFIYSYYRGQPKNLYHPTGEVSGAIFVTVRDITQSVGSQTLTTTPDNPVTGGCVGTGIYTASFALYTTSSVVYDTWWSGSSFGGTIDDSGVSVYRTGSFKLQKFDASIDYFVPRFVTNIMNLEPQYSNKASYRLRLFTRPKDWSPTIYTIASKDIENYLIEDGYYKVYRVIDQYNVIEYGTGSSKQTKLSYDSSGSYFDLDMTLLEPQYEYGIKFVYYINGLYEEQPDIFKFRVVE